jgi:hypothetical protein
MSNGSRLNLVYMWRIVIRPLHLKNRILVDGICKRDGYNVGMVKRLYYELVGAVHHNVKRKSGGLLNRLTARELIGLKPNEIEFIYLVEPKRNATAEEIRQLCKGDPKRQ